MKRAVIYYSLTGNTVAAASYVAEQMGADLFRIELVKPMPESFNKQILTGGMMVTLGLTPAIKGVPENIGEYDEIVVGTPIWAGKACAPINTLLRKYKIADKVTAVFTLSGGGDNDKCIPALQKLLKNLQVNVALADRKLEDAAKHNAEKLAAFVEQIR